MRIIKVGYQHSDEAITAVKEFLHEMSMLSEHWNGVRFYITRGDCTVIDNDESIEARHLMQKIHDILDLF
jgi:Mor family transcriptional regulator